MPDVIFDKEQRRNYHLAEGRKVWHEVPPGYELDEEGKPRPMGETESIAPSGGFDAAEEKFPVMVPAGGGFEAAEEEIKREMQARAEEPVAPAEVKKHGRSNRGA